MTNPVDFSDRRRLPRYPVRQIVTVKLPGPGLPSWGEDPGFDIQTGTSRDVSSGGIFLWVDARIPDGSPIEVLMSLPRELSQAKPVNLRCQGKVVRIEREKQRESLGVAVSFEHVEVVPPEK